jgi:hypothetical protein
MQVPLGYKDLNGTLRTNPAEKRFMFEIARSSARQRYLSLDLSFTQHVELSRVESNIAEVVVSPAFRQLIQFHNTLYVCVAV